MSKSVAPKFRLLALIAFVLGVLCFIIGVVMTIVSFFSEFLNLENGIKAVATGLSACIVSFFFEAIAEALEYLKNISEKSNCISDNVSNKTDVSDNAEASNINDNSSGANNNNNSTTRRTVYIKAPTEKNN